jgi:hypothetical protein
MKPDINTLISVLSFAGGVGATLLGVARWYNGTQHKKFAAEREFQHLKRDYETLSKAVAHIDDRQEQLIATVVEMRGALSVLLREKGGAGLPTFPLKETP